MRASKSMALMGTCQSQGPSKTANTMMLKTNVHKTASLWRLKRRQASLPGE
jgi:hypothetical protein